MLQLLWYDIQYRAQRLLRPSYVVRSSYDEWSHVDIAAYHGPSIITVHACVCAVWTRAAGYRTGGLRRERRRPEPPELPHPQGQARALRSRAGGDVGRA